MKVIQQSFEIITDISKNANKELRLIEMAGRTCYKSENKGAESTEQFIRSIIRNGHESVLEHSLLTVKFVTSRSVSHQLVRHRLCAFSQESQRYCNYSLGKFKDGVLFIEPVGMDQEDIIRWIDSCDNAEKCYLELLNKGCKPELARSVLPNSTKTELVMSANYREWRHILKERTSNKADPNMRALMISLLSELQYRIPIVFENV